ncbi:G-protein coupled receptor 151 [Latimeria chalumnae]|uniref:GPCR-2037 n=1 Tax=Latimeria chalumnae TaxID=7897 RepID=H3ACE5_LATCH|nr:PREDICTED: probable G-protein coupled receptor 151 [Latimeria chalumnae]|eukprot:XP_005996170.1 PREDICTED: probable G-protein coupled receptor 151 [Latimeria chalumnae]
MAKLSIPVSNYSTRDSSLHLQRFAGGYQPFDSNELEVLIPVLLGAICVAGFAGNVVVIGVLINNAKKGKPSLINSLILNLSIADICISIFIVPFRAASYCKATWNLGWFICRTSDWFIHACMTAKSITIAVVAKACYMYVSNPTKQVTIKYQTILGVILSAWVFAFMLPLPHWLFTTIKRKADTVLCILEIPSPADNFMSIFVNLYPIIVFCIPLIFAFFFFWRAYRRCQRRGTKTQNLRNQIRSRRLTLMLLSVTVAFTILWLPEWISWLWMGHMKEEGPSPPPVFIIVSQLLMFSISSVNPLIFLIMSEDFREGFKSLWKRVKFKNPQTLPGSHATQQEDTATANVPANNVQSQEQLSSAQDQDQDQDHSSSLGDSESPTSKKENIILPDVEQFWHDREGVPSNQDNDPTPWEHQETEKVN